mmetsp:Transcript_20822/g.45542  ORF Transcript_20822/g.45542 Transcript_20822/m.45542 type:complete len:577 (+) Transcript_20822:96-1826(+)
MIELGNWFDDTVAPTAKDQCGLFMSSNEPVPLKRREVSATVHAADGFCDVQESLFYIADKDSTVRFVFPLPPRAAVYRFKATIGDREVITEVKRKESAQDDYDAAVSQGHTAVLMKQEKGASLFSVDVGNLQAMEEAIVTFSYVRILNTVAGAVEFEHQATWVPPYLNSTDTANIKEVVDATPKFVSKVSYTLSYNIRAVSERGFLSADSASPITLTKETPKEWVVTLSEAVADPSRDFTLLLELPKPSTPEGAQGHVRVQQVARKGGKTKTIALATFQSQLSPQPAPGAAAPPRELWLVIDGSGSMGGSPIEQAKQAALFFVKDLPRSSKVFFNIAMFGDSYKAMWKQPRLYDEASQKEAVEWLERFCNANYGGTEVYRALQHVYSQPLLAMSRQILFLTDGGVSGNEEQRIAELVSGQAKGSGLAAAAQRTCIFTLGIGHGVHRGLVEDMATKSGGVAQFVLDDEGIAKKAGYLKRCALAVVGGCLVRPRLVARSAMVRVAPHVLPPRIFPDEPLQVLVEILRAEPGAVLELRGELAGSGADKEDGGKEGAVSIAVPLDDAACKPDLSAYKQQT